MSVTSAWPLIFSPKSQKGDDKSQCKFCWAELSERNAAEPSLSASQVTLKFTYLLLRNKPPQSLAVKTTFYLMTLWVKKPGEFNWTIFLFQVASAEFSQVGQMIVASSGGSNMAPLTHLEPWWASLDDLFIWPLQHGVPQYLTTYMAAQSSQSKCSKGPE